MEMGEYRGELRGSRASEPSPPPTSEDEVEAFVYKIASEASKSDLIKVLQELQRRYGYLPKAGLRAISRVLKTPLSKVYGVATFYHQFKLDPPGRYIILICEGTACHTKGNTDNYHFLRMLLSLDLGEHTTKDGVFSLEPARCFGCCSLAPVVMIMSRDGSYKRLYGHITPSTLKEIVAEYREKV
jgi:NADH-quinone oxidoreductase subunit E